MGRIFKKKSEIEKRLKGIQKEISSVDGNLQSLSRTVMKSKTTVPASRNRKEMEKYRERKLGDRVSGRFADYFSTSFQPVMPLRHERKIQRNKAIVMSVFVLVVLFWIVYRFFL